MQLSLTLTVILLCVTSALTVLCGYMGQRPMNPHKGPRMLPWRFLMLLFFTLSLFLLVHLLTVLGLKQDQPLRY